MMYHHHTPDNGYPIWIRTWCLVFAFLTLVALVATVNQKHFRTANDHIANKTTHITNHLHHWTYANIFPTASKVDTHGQHGSESQQHGLKNPLGEIIQLVSQVRPLRVYMNPGGDADKAAHTASSHGDHSAQVAPAAGVHPSHEHKTHSPHTHLVHHNHHAHHNHHNHHAHNHHAHHNPHSHHVHPNHHHAHLDHKKLGAHTAAEKGSSHPGVHEVSKKRIHSSRIWKGMKGKA